MAVAEVVKRGCCYCSSPSAKANAELRTKQQQLEEERGNLGKFQLSDKFSRNFGMSNIHFDILPALSKSFESQSEILPTHI